LALVKQPGLVEVTTGASLLPDWTPDSRSLVYDQGMMGGAPDADQASLGLIVMRSVRNAEGAIAISEKTKELAGVLHDGKTRVRCLKDGRILFNGYDLKLPLSGADLKELKQQLFMLDPQRHASLVHVVPVPLQDNISEELVFFEVSPDESQVLFLSKERYTVDVLTIATGEIEEVAQRDENKSAGLPSWRAQGEVVYFKGYPSIDGKKPARSFEIVVKKGKEERILSSSWSDAFLKGLGNNDQK
jgi:Tol biopolymer transport system component